MLYKAVLCSTIAFAALAGSAGQSWAQNAPGLLEEVIVTAERRESTVQKTPIAISVLSDAAIQNAGLTRPDELTKLVPGLAISSTQAGGYVQVSVRGIGSTSLNAFGDSAVSFNLDGVYLARATGPNGLFYDVARVEVLKGPQGTLYGRNATAGAINVITKKPNFEFGGEAGLEVGNYNAVRAWGAINLPATDQLAFRFAGQRVEHDGYLTNGLNDADDWAFRAHALYKPNEDVSLWVSADWYSQQGQGNSAIYMQKTPGPDGVIGTNDDGRRYANPSDPWQGPARAYAQPFNADGTIQLPGPGGAFVPATGAIGTAAPNAFVDNENWGIYAQLDWNLGPANLTILPAYRVTTLRSLGVGAASLDVDHESKARSLEVRLASSGESRLQWVAGGFYFHEEQNAVQHYFLYLPPLQEGFITSDLLPANDESWALFGQATYAFTDSLRGTLGLRYTEEAKDQKGTSRFPVTTTPLGPGLTYNMIACGVPGSVYDGRFCTIQNTGDDSWSFMNYRVGVEFDLRENSMLYANVSSGTHAGGFYNGTSPNSYEPEKLTAYAVGSKNRLFGGRLQLNAEAFYWKYQDKQVTHLGPTNPTGFYYITENTGAAENYGLDVEANWAPTANDLFGLSVTYLNATYDEFSYQWPGVFGPPATDCAVSGAPPNTMTVDCGGRSFPNAPKWQAAASYEHTFRFGDESSLRIGGRSHLQSEVWTDINMARIPFYKQKSFHRSDLYATYEHRGGMWSATAFVNNVEDVAVLQAIAPNTGNALDAVGLWAGIEAPRTYGLRFEAKF